MQTAGVLFCAFLNAPGDGEQKMLWCVHSLQVEFGAKPRPDTWGIVPIENVIETSARLRGNWLPVSILRVVKQEPRHVL